MGAIFSRQSDKRRLDQGLRGKQWPRMITSRHVRVALRKLRTDAKMTPEEFADEARVHRATVYRIEKLEKPNYPRIETISALVESRNLTVAQFFAQIEGLANPETMGTEVIGEADPLLDPRLPDFQRQLDRLIEAAVDKHLRAKRPSESRRERTRAVNTKSGSARRR